MRAECELSGPANTRFLRIRQVVETGSTNADLLNEAANGAPEGAVLLAEHQTVGRGRQGRPWLDSPRSSVLASWLLRPRTQYVTLLPLLTGLAVADALDSGWGVEVGVKWPNDVLAVVPNDKNSEPHSGEAATRSGVQSNERKLAGILVEASSRGSDLAVVVGVGLNVEFLEGIPEEVSGVATDLASLMVGEAPTPIEVLQQILRSVERYLQVLEQQGPQQLLDAYRSRCLTLGRQVRMETPGGIVEGRAVDIEGGGGLVLETKQGPTTVTAGDTHHLG